MTPTIDFVGIGASRCGTTWVHAMLKKHPDIHMGPETKESRFWYDRTLFCLGRDLRYQKGVDWYLNHIKARSDRKNGDISVHMLWDPVSSARLKKHFPDARLFAILRNPVEAAYSHYRQISATTAIAPSFDAAIEKYPDFIDERRYGTQLKRFYDDWGDQLKVFFYEDLEDNPCQFLMSIEEHIGVKCWIPAVALNKKINASGTPVIKTLPKILSRIQALKDGPLGVAWSWKITDIGRRALCHLSRITQNNQANRVSEKTAWRIKNELSMEIILTEKLTGRSLIHWYV